MAQDPEGNWMLNQTTVRPDYIPQEVMHLYPGYAEGCRRQDFVPDEKYAEERNAITPFQEKYGLEAEEGKPLPKPKKRKGGYLDPRSQR